MARVQRDNVLLDIKESEVQRYLDLGFNVLDEGGNIIKQCVPTDEGTLRMFYIEHTEKIEQLEAEVAKLKKENKQLKSKLKKEKVSEDK